VDQVSAPSRKQGRDVAFAEVEPWVEPVDGADLLDWIAEVFTRYIVLPSGGAEALALWTVHAHAHDLSEVSPILILKSPIMQCGKTNTMLLLGELVPRPLQGSSISASSVFRLIEKYRVTCLLDEADRFIHNEDLIGLLNNGHRKGNAIFYRTVPPDFEPRAFSVWGPKAVATIRSLADTLEDRAVTIPMRRKSKDEHVARFRLDQLGHLSVVRKKIARWVKDHGEELSNADPEVPESLDDRAQDNWRTLLAIADAAGGNWPKRARLAALSISLGRGDHVGARDQILGDCKGVIGDMKAISSAALRDGLLKLEERPWSEWGKPPRPLTQTVLAGLLKPYGIKSGNVRVNGEVLRGYTRADFEESWKRYVAGSDGVQDAPNATPFPMPGLDCSAVADGDHLEDKGDAWDAPEGGQS